MGIKILIIRNDHIGDLLLCTQVFREIKKAMPDSEITLIVSKIARPLVDKNLYIDRIIDLEIPKLNFSTIIQYFKVSRLLKKYKFDYGIDLRGSLINSFFLLFLSGIKNRISRIDFHPIIRPLLTQSLKMNPKNHMIEDNLIMINKGLNLKRENDWPEIFTDKNDVKKVQSFIKCNNLKKFICICPIASLTRKQWGLKNFETVLVWLNKKYPHYKLLIMGIKKDKFPLENLSKFHKNSIVVLDFNIRQMSTLFKKSSLVIAPDGGPMHIAWVSGANLVTLFPQSIKTANMERVVPLQNSTILWAKDKINIDSIKVEDVEKAVEEMLK